ncbi:RICIN domain-containing protein [Streptomyces sp. YS-3]
MAGFLGELTAELTVRELAERYGGSKTTWSDYRSGARVIPLGRLNSVVRDRVRDPRGRQTLLQRAHRLHEAALVAEAEAGPDLKLDEALRRAEADLAEAEGLVRSLLALLSALLGNNEVFRAAVPDPEQRPSERGRADTSAPTTPSPSAAPEADAHSDPAADGLVDRALRQLEIVRFLHDGARQILGRARAENRAALPTGSTTSLTAGTDLVLALARTADALAHTGHEVERLWQEHRTTTDEPLRGVVLERTDRPSVAQVIAHTALPPLPYGIFPPTPAVTGATTGLIAVVEPHRRPVRSSLGVAAVLAVFTVLAVAVSAATAVVVVGRERPAAPAPISRDVQPYRVQYLPSPGDTARSAPPVTTPPASPSPVSPSSVSQNPPKASPPVAPTVPAPGGGFLAPPSPKVPVVPAPSNSTSPPAQTPEVPDAPNGLFRLANAGSHLCLSVSPQSQGPAAGMVQTGCGENPEQQWHLTREAAGPPAVYSIRNRSSGLCLSVEGARVDNDVPVTHYLCGDRQGLFPDQFWTLRYRSAFRAWQLVNVNSGKCAGSRAGSRDNEPVLQQDCRDDPWLMWQS